MPKSRRTHALIAVALIAAAVFAWRCRDAASEQASADAHATSPRPTRHFEDGQWVERGNDDLARALGSIQLPPAGVVRVSGTVIDFGSRAPIPGAEVVLANPLGESSAWTDDDGHYELFVRPGTYRAFARADGYVAVGPTPIERVPTLPDANQIGLPFGQIAPLLSLDRDRAGIDLQLAGAAVVYGTVYDGSGRPVPGAIVMGQRGDSMRPVQGTHIDETDLDGSYRITVPAGHATIQAHHLDYAGVPGGIGRYLEPGDEARVDITLAAGCIIAGTVVDVNGERMSEGSLERYVGGSPPNDYRPAARIDADGDFRLALTEDARVTLRAWPWKSGPSQPRELDCYDGAYYNGVVFVAQNLDADLEGMIIGAEGAPVEHAFIDALPLESGGMAQQERADAYGEFGFYALPSGLYHIKAYVPGHGVAAQLVHVPSRGVRLRLGGTGAIAGRVLGLESGSVSMTVDACIVDGEVAADFDDVTMPDLHMLVPVQDGGFRVSGLPACLLSGRIRFGNRIAAFQASVTRDGVTPIDIDLTAH